MHWSINRPGAIYTPMPLCDALMLLFQNRIMSQCYSFIFLYIAVLQRFTRKGKCVLLENIQVEIIYLLFIFF